MRPPDAYREIRALLVQARKQAELTQTELAKRLNKPQSYVSKYETGERRLDILEFFVVAKITGNDPIPLIEKILNRDIVRRYLAKIKV